MLKSRKELAAGKSKIKEAISMNFRGDKKEYQELAESKEFQHMIADIMIHIMTILAVEFLSRVYKIGNIFA